MDTPGILPYARQIEIRGIRSRIPWGTITQTTLSTETGSKRCVEANEAIISLEIEMGISYLSNHGQYQLALLNTKLEV